MGLLDKVHDEESAWGERPQASTSRPLPGNDAAGQIVPIMPEEQARDARVIAVFVELSSYNGGLARRQSQGQARAISRFFRLAL